MSERFGGERTAQGELAATNHAGTLAQFVFVEWHDGSIRLASGSHHYAAGTGRQPHSRERPSAIRDFALRANPHP